jgi:Transcriptional regulators
MSHCKILHTKFYSVKRQLNANKYNTYAQCKRSDVVPARKKTVIKQLHVPLSHSVADVIAKMIFIRNLFLPGDRIPSEMQLAKDLKVSRTSIREAVRLLIAKGILEIQRGKGTFVTASPSATDDLLNISAIEDHRLLVRDWFEFRLILEPESARLATARASAEELDMIEHYERLSFANMGESDIFYEADTQLHIAIAKATHNQVIERLVPFLQDSVAEARQRSYYIGKDSPDPVVKNASVTHREIVHYMRQRDVKGAGVAMAYHIKRAMADLRL